MATFTVTPQRCVDALLLRKKSEVGKHCITFVKWYKRKTGVKVKSVDIDIGEKYLSITTSLKEIGIEHTTKAAYSTQLNCVAERMNSNSLKKVRAIMK